MRAHLITWMLLAPIAVPASLTGQAGRATRGGEITWMLNASRLEGSAGARFQFSCPSTTSSASVWGTDIYSDDSSICGAAVHTGAITPAGGQVLIELRDGRSSYQGSQRNGITSADWGRWHRSFVVVGGAISWAANATGITAGEGERVTLLCPTGGSAGTVWGSGPYTDDSSICTAAVHAGRIDFDGGEVTIEIRGGRESFDGSRRNGVATSNYGRWGRSFLFR